jgi:diguanylate cyclase (GGDEF)-like protein
MILRSFLHFDINLYAAVFLVVILGAMQARRSAMSFGGKLFRAIVVTTLAMLVLEMLSWRFDTRPGEVQRVANYAFNWLLLWLSPLTVSLWASYIDYRIHGSAARLKRRWFYLHPMVLCSALMILNFLEPLVFEVSAQNVYARGPLLWLNVATGYAVLAYIILMAIRHRKSLEFRIIGLILLLCAAPALGTIGQMLWYGALLIWPLMAMIVVLAFVFLENFNASIDHLTGLFNRTRVDEYVHSLVESKASFGVIVIDIDNFKAINDTDGHHAGDRALIGFAKALREVFREKGMIGRFGGDEFVVVSRSADMQTLKGLRWELADAAPEIGFSFGCAIYRPEDMRSHEELFIEADRQMYREKKENQDLRRRAGDRAAPEAHPG